MIRRILNTYIHFQCQKYLDGEQKDGCKDLLVNEECRKISSVKDLLLFPLQKNGKE